MTLLVLTVAGVSFGAMPRTISYQGVLKDSDGTPVADGVYELTFRLYDHETIGELEWSEIDSVSVSGGIFNAILGKATPLDLNFNETYWLSVEINGGGELAPRIEFTASPYAMRAAVADSALTTGIASDGDWEISGDDVYRLTGHVAIGMAPSEYSVLGLHANDDALLKLTNDNTGTGYSDGIVFSFWTSGSTAGYLLNRENASLSFGTNNTLRMRIAADGKVGIGTGTPAEQLDVVGGVRIGTTGTTNAGTMRWTGTRFQGYTGTAWVNLDESGGTGGGEGDITSVNTPPGSGLAGGADSGDVNLTVEPEGIEEHMIRNGAVTELKIAPGAVGEVALKDSAITGLKLATGAVTAGKIASRAIKTAALDTASVTNAKMAVDAVGSGNLINSAVTTDKIEGSAVTGAKILDGSLTFGEMASSGAGVGQVMKWNGSAWEARDDSLGGDGDITSVATPGAGGLTGGGDTGDLSLSIANGGVTGTMLADSVVTETKIGAEAVGTVAVKDSAITGPKLANGAVTSGKIASRAVKTAALDSASVTHDKVAVNAVGNVNLADSAVTVEKIEDNAITGAKIEDGSLTFSEMGSSGADPGQVMKWNGTAWVARDDSVGGDGDITAVQTPGAGGLTGGGDTGDLSLGIATGGVTGDMLADDAVTSAKIDSATIEFSDIAQNGASDGQVMKWNQTAGAWEAANDNTGAGGGSGWLDDGTVVRLETAGDSVGIGTASPTEKLHVEGNIRASGKATLGPNANTGDFTFVAGHSNDAAGDFATISGGQDNDAPGVGSTIGGGRQNSADTAYATVGGGQFNTALGAYSLVCGGGGETPADSNTALEPYCIVVGGRNNVAGRHPSEPGDGEYAVVGGGNDNRAYGRSSVVSGGDWNVAGQEGPGPYGNAAVVGGGSNNRALGDGCTVSGGNQNLAIDHGGTVAGGWDNTAGAPYAFVGGGRMNKALGYYSVVCGGGDDTYPDSNAAYGDYSFIGGGRNNRTGTGPGPVNGEYAVLSGGRSNHAEGDYSVVCGGGGDLGGDGNHAMGQACVIGGGTRNYAGSFGPGPEGYYAVVGGGYENNAPAKASTIAGGFHNTASDSFSTVSGGYDNEASGAYAAVAGGGGNAAAGDYSAALGGKANAAWGERSVALGTMAVAGHRGSVVISAVDNVDPDDSVCTGGSGQVVIRHDGCIYLTDRNEQAPTGTTHFLETSTGAYLDDTGDWVSVCDRDRKENFVPVDTEMLLAKVAALPITEWNYKLDDEGVRHIGPVAQDFQAVFGLGRDDKGISARELASVSLAAIQELNRINREQSDEIKDLKVRIEELETALRILVSEQRDGQAGR
jgi:hypothetical protein